MKKLILLCLFGLAFISIVKGAAECGLTFYGPPPPPVCNTYIDANGQKQTECYAVGPAASRAIVNKAQNTFYSPTVNLYELDYAGTCKCKLVLYSKTSYQGGWYSTTFSKTSGVIFANKVWKTANKSFKITCTF